MFEYNLLIYLIPIFRYFIPKYWGKFINENSKQNADKHQKVFSVQNILWASQFRSRWNISCTPWSHGSCCGQYVMCIFRRWEGVREAEEGEGRGWRAASTSSRVAGAHTATQAPTIRPRPELQHTAAFHNSLLPPWLGSGRASQWENDVRGCSVACLLHAKAVKGRSCFFKVCTALPDVNR